MKVNRILAKRIMLGGVSFLSVFSMVVSISTFYKVNHMDRPPMNGERNHGPHCEMNFNPEHGSEPRRDHRPRREQGSEQDKDPRCDNGPNHEQGQKHGIRPKNDQEPPKNDFLKEKETTDAASEEKKKN